MRIYFVNKTILFLLIITILNLTSCIVKKTGTNDTQTNLNLIHMKVAILAFYAQTKELPNFLDDLYPTYIEDKEYFIDQWDNKFQYEIIRQERKLGFKLISYGADKKKGGFWKNKDVIIEHFIKK
jgi:hypothetical protein